MSRVALVEDHARLAGMIRQALSGAGIETDIFSNLSEAHYGISQANYAVLILDRGLPDGDGLAFLRKLREAGRMMPCLMLTARDALHDRIDGRLWVRHLLRGRGARGQERGGEHSEERQPSGFHDPG